MRLSRSPGASLQKDLRLRAMPVLLLLLASHSVAAQVNTGELQLATVTPGGLPIAATVTVTNLAADYRKQFTTDINGRLNLRFLPYGSYQVDAAEAGLEHHESLEIQSALPLRATLMLTMKPVATVVDVSDAGSLVDPFTPTSVMRLGERQIAERPASLPGRTVQDLVNSQPGWLYEGNAVLHPRGSEYQTQFVIDGIPLTDNRSPGLGPEIEADNLESVSIYTAGIPAEYGRKMGGVVELNTRRDHPTGTHGEINLGGGSFATRQGYAQLQSGAGKTSISITAAGSGTSYYLNPVVPENFTNRGTTGDFSSRLDRSFGANNTLNLAVRHELSRFQIPNELLQQDAGQLEHGGNQETLGTAQYQHVFSASALMAMSLMVRDTSHTLDSNPASTPIFATQRNHFREVYFKDAVSLHRGRHEFKFGFESDTTLLHENFSYSITDPTRFDDDTPPQLNFKANKPDLEQSAFVEDQFSLGSWTIAAGLRYDLYQLLLNRNAISPRLSVARGFAKAGLVLHASYDRVFQTPAFENILISSSTSIEALSDQFLRLPVTPSDGNYFEGGLTKAIADHATLSLNVYRRNVSNYADDDQLLNTGVSYPIAFDHAVIYGAESRLALVNAGRLSGFLSYSYMVGNVWYPVTGGLFLGDDASSAASEDAGHFPDSQDQRNTLRTRFRYQVSKRLWLAAGLASGSGLPFEYQGSEAEAKAQYGRTVTARINFERGRVSPTLSSNLSAGAELYRREGRSITLQADGDNLNNRLNLIDFGGLFSGNAIAPPRSYALRLSTKF